ASRATTIFLTMKKVYSQNSCKVTFSLPKVAVAEQNPSVVVLGDFNNWDKAGIPLEANGENFHIELELETGRDYQFRYLINERRWENDWNADKYVPSPYEGILNSVVSVPAQESNETVTAAEEKTEAALTIEKAPLATTTPIKEVTATPEEQAVEATAATDETKAEAVPAAEEEVAVKATKKKTTAKKKKAAKPKKDNLKRIEGIGPKISSVLTEAGVDTFQALANATPERIREILVAANPKYKMYTPDTWPEQAELAAKGDWDALKTLQDELDGGKRK
ncbi:MAG: helix-hairpin-helix domain-containing protein, partial [Bacteroidota bacterium]